MLKQFITSKLLGIIILISSLGTGWYIMDVRYFLQSPLNLAATGSGTDSSKKAWRYDLQPGSSLTAVANDLYTRGIIKHPKYLTWIARLHDQDDKIQSGEYLLEQGITIEQFLAKITRGDVIQYPFTIIEGWRFKQLRRYISILPALNHDLKGLAPDAIMAKLAHEDTHPEGRFYPDTYYYTRGMSESQLLSRAYIAMDNFLLDAWTNRDLNLPLNSATEALILASIIEKETAVASERRQIAGVFIRRLQRRMRLQTDPTVIYGLGDQFDGNLRSRDLKNDTPYNTYRRHGLPPTPIAMPGADSILAALHPEDGDTLYFVARGDGTHYFSATITEHNQAVRKFQLKKSGNGTR